MKAGLLLGGVALAVAACGSGSGASTATSGSTGSSSGAIVMTETVNGTKALADASGHTLYSTSAESGGHIYCVDGCTSFWKPLMASQQQARQASTALHQTFSTVNRPSGGGTQLTYHGLPLYTFTQEGTHSMKGNGFKDNFQGTSFTWSAAVTKGSPSAPKSSSSGSGNGGGGGYGY